MNKEELLKAIEQKRQAIWPTDTGKMDPATVPNNLEQGWLNALRWMENFINTLTTEQPSEDLEKEIDRVIKEVVTPETLRDYIMGFIAGAQWQKNQTINKACEWLNKNVVEYHPRKGELRPIVNINAFREAMGKEDEPNRVNIEPPSFEESQGEFNSYNVALNG